MEMVKVSQVAKTLGVSLNSVYRKVKLCETELNGQITKEGGITFISREGIEILRGHFPKLNPSESLDNRDFARVSHLEKVISDQQRTIETLLSQSEEGRKRTDTILMKLTNDISSLQKALEYKVTVEASPLPVSPPVKPWQPELKKQASFTWLEEIWFSFWKPERLRAEP